MSKTLLFTLVTAVFLSASSFANNDSLWNKKPSISLFGFLDAYYVYDFNQPKGTSRQPFLYNHNRHNEFNLNLGLIKLGLESDKYRANLALQTGTYANDNYAAEPGLLKSIFEANVGISINRSNSLWLDVGVMPSHIGFESAISSDNLTLTRSLLAENSPYFLSGAKLTYTASKKLEIAGLVVNGWQRIQRLPGNSMPSLGSQVVFTPSKKTKLNWSTFIGTDNPDSTRRMRYFNNLFGVFQISEKFNLISAFDIGVQQKLKGSSAYDVWMSPIVILQFALNDQWKTSIRGEYYQDESGVIIPTNTPNGFETSGVSLNFDYSPSQNVMFRIEGRWLNSKDFIFEPSVVPANNNYIVAGSIAIKFEELVSRNRNN